MPNRFGYREQPIPASRQFISAAEIAESFLPLRAEICMPAKYDALFREIIRFLKNSLEIIQMKRDDMKRIF